MALHFWKKRLCLFRKNGLGNIFSTWNWGCHLFLCSLSKMALLVPDMKTIYGSKIPPVGKSCSSCPLHWENAIVLHFKVLQMSSNGMLKDLFVMTLKAIPLKKVGRFFGPPSRTTLVFKIQERDQGPRSASNARPSADIHHHTDHLRLLTISTGSWYKEDKIIIPGRASLQMDDRSVSEIWIIHVQYKRSSTRPWHI